MPSDRSRRTDDLRDGYDAVVAQQGRVILDRDFNASQGLTGERIARDALAFVGPCGTPDDGFRISLPVSSPPGPPLWSPPAALEPATREDGDFLISPGTMYVGGRRAEWPGRQSGHAITYGYYDQPDWIDPPDPFAGGTTHMDLLIRRRIVRELIYLDLAEQEVGGVEDPELLDVALGGPDTTQRVKLMRRVRRETIAGVDCATAWDEAVALWLQRDGLRLEPETMRLAPVARLQVGFTQDVAASDPCDPVATGGYLGADNQLIRVQISATGTVQGSAADASLLWGYDNASFLYRVAGVSGGGTLLTLAQDPPDAFHIPQTGQLVEILRTAAVLGREPDESDPTGQRSILRVVAEASGELRRLTQPYGPVASGDPASYIVLDSALPDAYVNDAAPLFVRVWQAQLNFRASGDTVALTDPATGASTGVEVTISLPPGEALTVGAFWLLAMRPATPQAVYPERLLVTPQPPDGPRRWACPLAVIDWTNDGGALVTDCRQHFDSLVALTRRRPGCCSLSVGPADVAALGGLQAAADRAALLGLGAKLCLAPGLYILGQPLRLTAAHRLLTIEACGPDAVLRADPGADPSVFADGLVVVADADQVTLRGLDLAPAPAPIPATAAAILQQLLVAFVAAAQAAAIIAAIRAMIGVRAIDCASLTLEDCTIGFGPAGRQPSTDVFAAGVLLQGDCSGFALRGCEVTSALAPTFTPVPSGDATTAAGATATSASTTVSSLGVAVSSPVIAVSAPGATVSAAGAAAASPAGAVTVEQPSPPLAASLIDRVTSTLATLATRPAAAQTQQLIATAGVMANTLIDLSGGKAQALACSLGDTTIRDNRFVNLTMAAYCAAGAGTARVQDNTATGCVGGLWLELPQWQQPSASDKLASALFTPRWNAVAGFAERLVLDVLALTYPLPAGTTVSGAASSGATSLFLLNNQIEALPAASGAAALVVLANLAVSATADTSVALLMSGNRLRSRAGGQIPTALILLPDAEHCAMTGNLIINERTDPANSDTAGASLWLVPNTLANNATLLSVVGNVLVGASDLADLLRAGSSPAQSWAPYNAIPG